MSGVKAKFLRAEDIVPRLKQAAERLCEKPEVLEVSLFGSFAKNNYSPESDADIFILLSEDERRITERIQDFSGVFSGIGISVEVFPYTTAEVKQMRDAGFMKTILKEKILLAKKA